MLDISTDFAGVPLSIMRPASASCMSSSETVNLAYAHWRSVSVGDAGRGIPTMVVLCTSISLLKKSRLCMYKVGNVYFWKKTYCLQIPSTSIPPVHCKIFAWNSIQWLPSLYDMYFKFSKCIFSVIIRRLWVICIYINSYTSTCI